MEAGRDGAPERTRGPLERVTLAVYAHLLGTLAEFLTDGLLPLRVAGGSTQIKEGCKDVVAIAARVIQQRLIVLLKVHTEVAVAGGQQQAGRSVHAHVS